jgi:ABC-type cobalamin/Fe3+-siderophores transport system ATPase subunit
MITVKENMLILGPGGSGKSHLIKKLKEALNPNDIILKKVSFGPKKLNF